MLSLKQLLSAEFAEQMLSWRSPQRRNQCTKFLSYFSVILNAVSTGNESPPPADGFETSQIGLVSAVFLPEAALGGILQYGNASFPHRILP